MVVDLSSGAGLPPGKQSPKSIGQEHRRDREPATDGEVGFQRHMDMEYRKDHDLAGHRGQIPDADIEYGFDNAMFPCLHRLPFGGPQ